MALEDLVEENLVVSLCSHPVLWPTRSVVGSVLLGLGMFNVIEGIIDHYALGIHHVNEVVGIDNQRLWDTAFLLRESSWCSCDGGLADDTLYRRNDPSQRALLSLKKF
jgi:hypothetical protein